MLGHVQHVWRVQSLFKTCSNIAEHA